MSKKKIKWKWWLFSIYHSSRILTDLYFPVDIYSMYKHLISTFWINFATPTDTESLSDPPSSLSPSLPLFPRHNSSPSCPSSALHWSHSLRWQDKQTNGQDYFTLVMLVGWKKVETFFHLPASTSFSFTFSSSGWSIYCGGHQCYNMLPQQSHWFETNRNLFKLKLDPHPKIEKFS